MRNLFEQNRYETLEKRPTFTFGAENSDTVIVNETFTITGYIQLQAYGLSNNENDMGFEVIRSIRNESGAARVVDWTITNQTKGTTLSSGSINLGSGQLSTITNFYPIDKISQSDYIRYTISNQGIGTASGNPVCAQMSFKVKSVFLREDGE